MAATNLNGKNDDEFDKKLDKKIKNAKNVNANKIKEVSNFKYSKTVIRHLSERPDMNKKIKFYKSIENIDESEVLYYELEENMKRKKIIIITIILITLVVYMNFIPFEQWIFRFETPEEAIKFDYIAKVDNIKSKIEIDEFAYISYIDKNEKLGSKYLIKDSKGWISPIKKVIISSKYKRMPKYRILSYMENGKNILIIKNVEANEEKLIESISDNINTDFKYATYKYEGEYYRNWMGIIEKYPEDYKIYIDSEEIKLLV